MDVMESALNDGGRSIPVDLSKFLFQCLTLASGMLFVIGWLYASVYYGHFAVGLSEFSHQATTYLVWAFQLLTTDWHLFLCLFSILLALLSAYLLPIYLYEPPLKFGTYLILLVFVICLVKAIQLKVESLAIQRAVGDSKMNEGSNLRRINVVFDSNNNPGYEDGQYLLLAFHNDIYYFVLPVPAFSNDPPIVLMVPEDIVLRAEVKKGRFDEETL